MGESFETVEGRHAHRRTECKGGNLRDPANAADGEHIHAGAITLSSSRLGLIAKMDLIEGEGARVMPVDCRRGKWPHVLSGAYVPERVQLCVPGLILEVHGYTRTEGVLYLVTVEPGKVRLRLSKGDLPS